MIPGHRHADRPGGPEAGRRGRARGAILALENRTTANEPMPVMIPSNTRASAPLDSSTLMPSSM